MSDPYALANCLILAQQRAGYQPLTPLKLARLVYLADSACSQGETSFLGDAYQVYPYGPSHPSLRWKYRGMAGESIHHLLRPAGGPSLAYSLERDERLAQVVPLLLARASTWSAAQVTEATRLPGGAWHRAWQEGRDYVTAQEVAQDRSYAKLFSLF